MNRFVGKTVLVVGASGGLGSAIAQAFAAEGAALAVVGHRRLPEGELPGAAAVSRHLADLTDAASLAVLVDEVLAIHGRVHVVVNATGCDVRKPLPDHTTDDFRRSLEVNLLGAMLLTQVFLPVVGDGMIVHLGGFADGRLAFPFYSADAASRAGLHTFCEAVNRELALDAKQARVLFFSPSPADTDAERPFHPLWRELGTTIVAPAAVAAELVTAVGQRKQVHIMGGWTTRLFAAINAVSPRLADVLLMRRYGAALRQFFNRPGGQPPDPSARPPSSWGRTLGLILIAVSFLVYGGLLGLPFLPLAGLTKLALAPVLVVVGEATFWVGGALVGREVVARYRQVFSLGYWRRCLARLGR